MKTQKAGSKSSNTFKEYQLFKKELRPLMTASQFTSKAPKLK
jgi:hypothetical protein